MSSGLAETISARDGGGWCGGTGVLQGVAGVVKLVEGMAGLRVYVFISVNDVGILHNVAPRGAPFNPLWLLTRPPLLGCNRTPS